MLRRHRRVALVRGALVRGVALVRVALVRGAHIDFYRWASIFIRRNEQSVLSLSRCRHNEHPGGGGIII